MTIIDITYQTNIGERHGRRRMYDNHTGEVWWEPVKSMGPVEPLPPASAERLSLPIRPHPSPSRSPNGSKRKPEDETWLGGHSCR